MKIKAFTLIFIAAFAFSCATVEQNIIARKNLEKCEFRFINIVPERVNISGTSIESVDFTVNLEVNNKSDGEVVLDRVEGDIILDENKAASISRSDLSRIPAGEIKVEPINVNVPFKDAIKAASGMPDEIIVKARVYVNILIGYYTLNTPVVFRVERTFPVPYDRIKEMAVEQGRERVIDSFKDLLR